MLGLKTPVESTMSDEQILGCIDWMAHGFEIVVSVFPGWKFTAADTPLLSRFMASCCLDQKPSATGLCFVVGITEAARDVQGQVVAQRISGGRRRW